MPSPSSSSDRYHSTAGDWGVWQGLSAILSGLTGLFQSWHAEREVLSCSQEMAVEVTEQDP